MRVQRTWNDNWNNYVRYVLFPDEELRELMMIPEDDQDDLRLFLAKYLVEDPMSDIIVEKQDVIITYYDERGTQHGPPQVHKKYKSFDIFVKQEHLYDCDEDRMRARTKRIAQRIKELLTDKPHQYGLNFTYVDDYPLGTKLVGYVRYHLQFSYFTTS